MKKKMFDNLIDELSLCQSCNKLVTKGGRDVSLINIFEDKEFGKNIPSIWTDWYNHLDANIMIIGQDWGPYIDMKELYDRYKKGEDYNYLINEEKSMTKKMLFKYLEESALIENYQNYKEEINNLYITNGIMCARKGTNYRGNNIDLKYSTNCCTKYLKKQIDIVKPKVIISLGYYPLMALASIFNFSIEKTLADNIKSEDVIHLDNYVIIPMYHPTAQIKKSEQLKQYMKIWKYL